MRIVALEEHFTVPALVRRIDPGAISRRGFRPRKVHANGPNPLELLPDIGERLKRPISRAILDQVWLTTSGIFSEPPLLAALLTFGIDRIMFSVDHPHAPNAKGRDFLDGISLAPAGMAKLTHSNADALLKLKVGVG
jgi:hypothetical protein